MNHSLPGSSVHGIFQARILKWVAISSFRIFPTQVLNLSLLHLLCLQHWQADFFFFFFTTEPSEKSDSKVVERPYLDFSVFLTKQNKKLRQCISYPIFPFHLTLQETWTLILYGL